MGNEQKTVWIGFESSGKSLMMFRRMVQIIDRNSRYINKYNTKPRAVATNSAITTSLAMYAKSKGVELIYVQDIDDIVKLRGCDLFLDELSIYFDARKFADLPLYVRRWSSQASKLGVHIYGTTQNWQQVDIAFRRLTDNVTWCSKFAGSKRPHPTFPSSKKPWAWFCLTEYTNYIDKSTGETVLKPKGILFKYTYTKLNKNDVRFFETGAEIEEGSPPPLRKVVRTCPEDGFQQVRYI